MNRVVGIMVLVLWLAGSAIAGGIVETVKELQEISVTVAAAGEEGSGVLITRGDTSYVLTAGHVVEKLRNLREVYNPRAKQRETLVEFETCSILRFTQESGQIVEKNSLTAEVVSYSSEKFGDDLALLRILKKKVSTKSARFDTGQEIPGLGTALIHIGGLKGSFGSNSVTTGIYSQIGRTLKGLRSVFDQVSCTAFPGSSGGGVFLEDGRYIGTLVRTSGETFNFIIPARRIREWTKKHNVGFILDPSLPVPSKEDIVLEVGESSTTSSDGRLSFTPTGPMVFFSTGR